MTPTAYAIDDTFDYGPALLPASTQSTLTSPQQYLATQTRHMSVAKFQERQRDAVTTFVSMNVFQQPRPYVDPALLAPRMTPAENTLEQGLTIAAEFLTPALLTFSFGSFICMIAGAVNLMAHAILTLQAEGSADPDSWSDWGARKVVQMTLAAALSGACVVAVAIAFRVGEIVIILLPVMIITAIGSLSSSVLNRAVAELIKNRQSIADATSKLFSSTMKYLQAI